MKNESKMQYRTGRHGLSVSALGFGCMRFTRDGRGIDVKKAEREVAEAMELGVNYFDTAYYYAGNEAAVGEIMSHGNRRENALIATKLPLFYVRGSDSIDKLFETQLKRLKTDYIDYYLMHMLNDKATWERLHSLGIEEWLLKKQQSGQIRRVGFSYHGDAESFRSIVDAYDWDMCQIQYNYMDENYQAGRAGLNYAASKGIPVVIMEPLRGGRLVNLLPRAAKERIARDGGGSTAAQLALRWLFDQPEIMCVLSGMNSLEMVRENAETARASPPGCLTEEERRLISDVRADIMATTRVACTGCGYCMPCPAGVDIPTSLHCLNLLAAEGFRFARKDYLRGTTFRSEQSSASQCIDCGACERHCPQNIEIRKHLRETVRELERFPYRAIKRGIKLFKIY